MLTATEIYNQLKEQADKFGYSTLSREEGRFLKRYQAFHVNPLVRSGATTTAEHLKGKTQRTWSGAAPSGAPKRSNRRRTGRARVWVDKSLATWKAPASVQKEGITSGELLAGMPSVYTREKKQPICS
ncbi:hypothetical protein SynRS9907_50012 [Synechococcus sp. RS9907]|nr:hypothetical protein SynRS9907_50012 [Synechococcus sp. RS9907]